MNIAYAMIEITKKTVFKNKYKNSNVFYKKSRCKIPQKSFDYKTANSNLCYFNFSGVKEICETFMKIQEMIYLNTKNIF